MIKFNIIINNFNKIFIISVMILVLFQIKCDEGYDSKDMQNIIPPESTMIVDFTSFININPKKRTQFETSPFMMNMNDVEILCWNVGEYYRLWAYGFIFNAFSFCMAAYKDLLNQKTSNSSDNSAEWNWKWERNNMLNNVSVKASKIDDKEHNYQWEWTMNINNRLYIKGKSSNDKTKGEWVLYNPVKYKTDVAAIEIKWGRIAEKNYYVKYTNIDTINNLTTNDTVFYSREESDISVKYTDMHKNIDMNGDKDTTDDVDRDMGAKYELIVYWNLDNYRGAINIVNGTSCSWDPSK